MYIKYINTFKRNTSKIMTVYINVSVITTLKSSNCWLHWDFFSGRNSVAPPRAHELDVAKETMRQWFKNVRGVELLHYSQFVSVPFLISSGINSIRHPRRCITATLNLSLLRFHIVPYLFSTLLKFYILFSDYNRHIMTLVSLKI